MSTKLLIIGSTGLAGSYFVKKFSENRNLKIFEINSQILDLSQNKSEVKLNKFINDFKPEVILNLSGLTNVDLCEIHPKKAQVLNHDVLKKIISCKFEFLIHFSTDQVYPGHKGNYKESEEKPINVYGKTKLLGEKILNERDDSLILRTNFFGKSPSKKKSLSDFFIDAFKKKEKINLFTDLLFSPLNLCTLSNLMEKIILRKRIPGTFNLGSKNGMSKADFAINIAKHLKLSTKHTRTVSSNDIKFFKAKRPKDIRMNVSTFENYFGSSLPSLEEEIRKL